MTNKGLERIMSARKLRSRGFQEGMMGDGHYFAKEVTCADTSQRVLIVYKNMSGSQQYRRHGTFLRLGENL